MKKYYQVCASFRLSAGSPSLVSLSLHTVSEYYPFLAYPGGSSLLSLSRFFRSVPEAEQYINYLFSLYPNSTAPMPVLDPLQFLLF